jgi:hypothetical protein
VFVAYIYIYISIRRKHRLHIELRFGCDDEAEPTKLTPQVLAPLVEAFPDRIPSIYEVADILGELDRLCGGSLLKAGGSAEVLASKTIDLAKKLNPSADDPTFGPPKYLLSEPALADLKVVDGVAGKGVV